MSDSKNGNTKSCSTDLSRELESLQEENIKLKKQLEDKEWALRKTDAASKTLYKELEIKSGEKANSLVYKSNLRLQEQSQKYHMKNKELIEALSDLEKAKLEIQGKNDILEKTKLMLEKQSVALKENAFTDTLTGLIIRKPFLGLLEQSIRTAKRENIKLAVLFLDLEKFKTINDIYGHKTGDTLLTTTAKKIKVNLRTSDFVGRFGGDEFVVCLNNIKSLAGACNVAEKINEAFSDKIKIDDLMIDMGISIGIAVYPEDGKNASELLKNSDLAMYKAKSYRNNTFQTFNTKFQEELQFNLALKNALNKNEYINNYQMIVDSKQNFFAAEQLLRWESPEFGTVMPSDFIHILENNRSIIGVGEWAFRESCSKMKVFNDRLNDPLYSDITESFISLIKKIDKFSIAEGVETKEQFENLRNMGCDYFQGFYFSKPHKDISNNSMC